MTYVIVLGAPGTEDVVVSSSAVEMNLRQDGRPATGRLLVTHLPGSIPAVQVGVTGYRSGQVVYEARASGGAVGDSVAVPVDGLEPATDGMWAGVVADERVAAGQLVVTAEGAVGVVVSVTGSRVLLRPLAAAGTELAATVDISGYSGTVGGTGDAVEMRGLPAGARVEAGNRIVVIDPAQGDPAVGTVTAGTAASPTKERRDAVAVNAVAGIQAASEMFLLVPDRR
jgi:hypothetical protein